MEAEAEAEAKKILKMEAEAEAVQKFGASTSLVIGHKQRYCRPCAIVIKFDTLCKDARVREREREAISMNLLEAEIRVWK